MTRNDVPEPVDATPFSMRKAAAHLEADLRRMGLGIQADRALAIYKAATEMQCQLEDTLHTLLASPND